MPVRQSDLFYCEHLGASERDRQDIRHFSVRDERGEGLVNYLQHSAFPDEEAGHMRTYLVRENSTSELVAYFSLKAGLVSLDEIKTEMGIAFNTLPGVELANFALNNEFIRKRPEMKGLGLMIFTRFVRPLIKDASKVVGVKFIYIFALPYEGLIERYGQYGFKRFEPDQEADLHRRLKPSYDDECIFMYQIL